MARRGLARRGMARRGKACQGMAGVNEVSVGLGKIPGLASGKFRVRSPDASMTALTTLQVAIGRRDVLKNVKTW